MQKNQDNSVILVLGGVRSGKSRYAQQLAEHSSRVTSLRPPSVAMMRRCTERSNATAQTGPHTGLPWKNLSHQAASFKPTKTTATPFLWKHSAAMKRASKHASSALRLWPIPYS
jgi:Cobinamide kinase / cobinamide phosphate guanyltransferase